MTSFAKMKRVREPSIIVISSTSARLLSNRLEKRAAKRRVDEGKAFINLITSEVLEAAGAKLTSEQIAEIGRFRGVKESDIVRYVKKVEREGIVSDEARATLAYISSVNESVFAEGRVNPLDKEAVTAVILGDRSSDDLEGWFVRLVHRDASVAGVPSP